MSWWRGAELSSEDFFSGENVFALEYLMNVHAFGVTTMYLNAHIGYTRSHEGVAVLGAGDGAPNLSSIIYREVHLSRCVVRVLISLVEYVSRDTGATRGVCVIGMCSINEDFRYPPKLPKHIGPP